MLGSLIGLILLCIILGAVFWGAQQLLALVPLAEPFATIVRVLMVILLVVIVIYAIVTLLGFAGINVPFGGLPLGGRVSH
jgi:hypothetical protein